MINKHKIAIFLLLAFTFSPATLIAQNKTDLDRFDSSSQEKSVLYRGRQAFKYNFRYNGTYYWQTTEFRQGTIDYNGKHYDNVLLNVDALRNEVLIRRSVTSIAITLDNGLVDGFTIGDDRFVNLRKQGYANMPEGYYKVLHDGRKRVYMKVFKRKGYDDSMYSGINAADGTTFNPDARDYFYPVNRWYYESEGKIIQINGKKGLLKLYDSQHRRELKKHIGENRIDERHIGDTEGFMREILDYMEPTLSLQSKSRAEQAQSADAQQVVWTRRADESQVQHQEIVRELPAGWFEQKSGQTIDPAYLKYIEDQRTIASFQNKRYQIGDPHAGRTGKAFVHGYVRNVATGEPLAGVSVYDELTKAYTVTDADGYYTLKMGIGEGQINYAGYSMEDMKLNVNVFDDGELDVMLKEKVTSLKEAVVSAESVSRHRDAGMGIEKVRINTISKVAVAFGEADVLKVMLTLPGVKSVGEASSGFNVRGGSVDQNLILFNDGTIYNPSHLFGIFSAFNTEVINDVELYKSSIPVEYGGRISSVMNVRGRDGNANKVTGSLGLGILTSRFHIEGPLDKGKTTFILGGRTTYSDWILGLIPEGSGYHGGSAQFYDINGGISHKFNEKNSLHLNGYFSRDKFSFSGDTTFHYSNLNLSAKWRSNFNARNNMTFAAGFDQYTNTLDNYVNASEAYFYDTAIRQAYAKLTFKSSPDQYHTFTYGLHGIYYMMSPGTIVPMGDKSMVLSRSLAQENAFEGTLFAGDSRIFSQRFSLDWGLRVPLFLALDPNKFYALPEIRVAGKYSIRDNLTFKAGVNTMRQYIHLITNTSSISPMDTWKLSDADIRPQDGWQGAGGIYWTVADGTVDLSLEGYYKRMYKLLDYDSGATLVMNDNLANDLVETHGKAYGVEFMAKKAQGKLNGWVSYTYSRILLQEMHDRGTKTINGGDWYPAPHDKPHDVKVVGNYRFTHRYSLSFNLDYSTGHPVTLPVGKFEYGGGTRLAYTRRNAYRIPDYFRLDLAVNVDPGHYLRKLTHMSITFGVYNVTGRKNAYSIYYTTHGGNSLQGYMLSVFASQIPYVNLNLKF